MECSEIQIHLSAYYDNELSTELRAIVDNHVGTCAECAAELDQFKSLSSLAAGLDQPEMPASVWTAVKEGLEHANQEQAPANVNREGEAPAELAKRETRPHKNTQFLRRFIGTAAAIAATLLIGFVGWSMWHGDHDHTAMAQAMEQVAADINSESATTLLLKKYGGSEVSYQDAITQVGYQPVASRGLPKGYSVEGIQILDMPCCKCTQTACRRTDNSRFFIYEHDNEDTGWFEQRTKRACECGGTICEVVELDGQLAATWATGKRYVTLLGVRDESEIELLVSQFDASL